MNFYSKHEIRERIIFAITRSFDKVADIQGLGKKYQLRRQVDTLTCLFIIRIAFIKFLGIVRTGTGSNDLFALNIKKVSRRSGKIS